jgi:hypothetical protein
MQGRRVGAVLVVAAGFGFGCSSSPPTQATNAPTSSTTATTAGAGAGGGSTTASSATSGPGSSADALGEVPDKDTGGAAGSGCSPGGDTLPDGWWFGQVTDEVTDTLALDLSCFFTGQAAIDAAAEDGQTVENDVYIRNDSTTVRETPLADGVVAQCLTGGTADLQACDATDASGPVWIRVIDGHVDRILEQFFP